MLNYYYFFEDKLTPYIAIILKYQISFLKLNRRSNFFIARISSLLCFYVNYRNFFLNSLDRPSPAGEDGVIEGTLVRKHEWESTTKKASNRSWDKVSL